MHPKNTTGHNRTQHLNETQPINFADEFIGGNPPTVAEALSESSSLLCSAKVLLAELSGAGPIDESAALGILFIVAGAKALLDSTHVSVCRAVEQGGAQ